MKQLILLSISMLLFTASSIAQLATDSPLDFIEFDTENKEVIFRKVFEFPDMKVEELITKSEAWAVKEFGKMKEVVQLKTENTLTVKGYAELKAGLWNDKKELHFLTTIETKEGKVRITIDNIILFVVQTGMNYDDMLDTRTTKNEGSADLFKSYFKNNGTARYRNKKHTEYEEAIKELFSNYKSYMEGEGDKW
jgi:hypothetical protein